MPMPMKNIRYKYNGVIYDSAAKAVKQWAEDTGYKLPKESFSAPRYIIGLKLPIEPVWD